MAVRIRIDGAEELRRELLELDARLHRPLTPLLDQMGQLIVTWSRDRIDASGADLQGTPLAWPPLEPQTLAIRRRHGHGDSPMLRRRAAQLYHNIRVATPLGADYVDVVSDLPYSGVVQRGGTTDRGGRSRTLPPRPYLALSDLQADDLAETVAAYLSDPASSPEARRA